MTRTAGQILRFGIVGAVATSIHVLLFVVLTQRLDGNAPLANLIAYLASWIASFMGHANFSFPAAVGEKRAPLALSAARYLQASIITLAASALCVHVVVSSLGLPYQYCVPLLVTVVPGLAFVLNKYWVFRPDSLRRLHGQDT